MSSTVALLLLACNVAFGAAVRNGGFLSLQADMRPDIVAKTLAQVEQEWNDETSQFLECNSTHRGEEDAIKKCTPENFQKSCPTVVGAILKASSGTRSVVTEYMGDVCNQNALQGWMQDRCQVLSSALADAMSDDSYENRENLDTSRFCQGFWAKFAQDEIHRGEREQKIRDEAALKAAEDAKKAADEAEAEKKRAEEEAAKTAAPANVTEAALKAIEDAKKSGDEAEAEKKKTEEEVAKTVAPANVTAPASGNKTVNVTAKAEKTAKK